MARFPVQIRSDTFQCLDDLVSDLERRGRSELVRISPHFESAEPSVRELFTAKVEHANPTWYGQHGDRLRQALAILRPRSG